MTPDDARAFCDDLQARVDQMGERTGEGMHLGRCLSVIRSLASQVDGLTLEVVRLLGGKDAPKRAKKPAADNTPPRLDE